jgi:phenylalanyl-tRNA synthetase alpha chain
MLDKLEELKQKAAMELAGVTDDAKLEAWRIRYLGKKSDLTQVLRGIAALPLEEKKTVGAAANEMKVTLEAMLGQKNQVLAEATMMRLAMQESMDITLPGRPQPHGRLHPLTQTLYEISDIFVSMGFGVVEGPDVEWNYYNFEALNIPKAPPGAGQHVYLLGG